MSKNKTRTKDKYRVVYNDTQRIELENEFRLNEYIAIPRKQEIAHKLQLSERQIKIWFQNRRAKKRKQQKRRQSTSLGGINSAPTQKTLIDHQDNHHQLNQHHQQQQAQYSSTMTTASNWPSTTSATDNQILTSAGLGQQHSSPLSSTSSSVAAAFRHHHHHHHHNHPSNHHQHQQQQQQQRQIDQHSSKDSSISSGSSGAAELAAATPTGQPLIVADESKPDQVVVGSLQRESPLPGDHQSVSPLYPALEQRQQLDHKTPTTATTPVLGSPQLIDQRHYQAEAIYQNRFFNQHQHPAQQQQHVSANQYYDSTANFVQDQNQSANAISMQTTNHQRHSFGVAWTAAAPTSVTSNPMVSPHQVAVSPQLATGSPPTATAALTNQQFHQHQHHHHHNHQQHQPQHQHQHHQHHQQQPTAVSPYSHHHATSYSQAAAAAAAAAAATNGYTLSAAQLAASPMSAGHPMHRPHGDTSPFHQHYMGQQVALGAQPQVPPPPPHALDHNHPNQQQQNHHHHHHHHLQHSHQQHQIQLQQHYHHQPVTTQVQSQHHHHHQLNQKRVLSSFI